MRRFYTGSVAEVWKLHYHWHYTAWTLSHPTLSLFCPTSSSSFVPCSAPVLTWTSEPGGEGALGIGDWGTGRVVTEGLGWSSGWGCWRTWLWWARQHPMASGHSGPWWPPQPLSSYQSEWSPHLGSHLRGQQITNKQGPLLLYRF